MKVSILFTVNYLLLNILKYKTSHFQQYYASGATEAEASKLVLEWNNQHGCGGNKDSPHKTNCNLVIQVPNKTI